MKKNSLIKSIGFLILIIVGVFLLNNSMSSFVNWDVICNMASDLKKLVYAVTKSTNTEDISLNIFAYIFNLFRPILQAKASNFSNEVLANQIHDLSVILFIMSVLISGLIFCLLLNILILLNSDRIINFFTNRFVRWYVNVNMKFIAFEVFCLGTSILYFMYSISIGLHYIATHPIIIS